MPFLIDSFNPESMRLYKTNHGTSVSLSDNKQNFDTLKEILEHLALLYEEDTETFHDQLNQLIEKIENAERKFFKLKYLTEFPDQASMMAEDQASMMAEMACKITDDQGQLNTDKLGSLVQHWSAHPSSYGETNENYIEILKQIVQILGTFPTPPQATVANTRNNIFNRGNTGMSGNTGMTTSTEDDGKNAGGAKKRGPCVIM